MKNKHLLLLFLITLGLGVLSRNWRWHKPVESWCLVRIDTSTLSQITLSQPDASEWILDHTDSGWAIEQGIRTFPVEAARLQPMWDALADLQSLRHIPTRQPDTFGILPGRRWRVTVREVEGRVVTFDLGHQVMEQGKAATYVWLDNDQQLYLVKGHLRNIFFQKMDFFRKANIADLHPDQVKSIFCNWPGDTTLLLHRHDSLPLWTTSDGLRQVPADSLHDWLLSLRQIRQLPFADDFDESRAARTLRAELILQSTDQAPLRLSLHRLEPPELPEEMPRNQDIKPRMAVAWVLHSSQNPINYFSLTDTALFFRWR